MSREEEPGDLASASPLGAGRAARGGGARPEASTDGVAEKDQLIGQLRAVNEQLALATIRAKEEAEQATETARRLQAVQFVTDVAISHLELDDLLQELLVRVRRVLAADTATMLLTAEDGQYLVPRVSSGLEAEVERQIRIPVGEGIAGRILTTREPAVVEDLSQVEAANALLRSGLRSLLGAPLLARGQPIGVVYVGTIEPRRFTQDDLQLLRLVGDRASLAIDQARLRDGEVRARTEAERERDRLRAIVNSVADEVWVCDAEGKIDLLNPEVALGLGLRPPEAEHVPLPELLPTLEILNPDGSPRPVEQAPLLRSLRGETVKGEEIVRHVETGEMREDFGGCTDLRLPAAREHEPQVGQIGQGLQVVHGHDAGHDHGDGDAHDHAHPQD